MLKKFSILPTLPEGEEVNAGNQYKYLKEIFLEIRNPQNPSKLDQILEDPQSLEIINLALPFSLRSNSETLLHYACIIGNLVAIEKLLAKGANLLASDNRGRTPLHYAFFSRNIQVVEKLLLGQDYNLITTALKVSDYKGRKPSHYAKRENDIPPYQEERKFLDQVFLMIKNIRREDKLKKLSKKDKSGRTIFHNLVLEGNGNEMAILLSEFPELNELANDQDEEGKTPLHYAAITNNQLITELLISCPEVKSLEVLDNEGRAPVHYAVMSNDLGAVILLVEQDIDLETADIYRKTPIEYAASEEMFVLLDTEISKHRTERANKLLDKSRVSISLPLATKLQREALEKEII